MTNAVRCFVSAAGLVKWRRRSCALQGSVYADTPPVRRSFGEVGYVNTPPSGPGSVLVQGRRLGFLPKPEAASERTGLRACSATWRQLLEFFGVAAAEHNLVGLKRGGQVRNHVGNESSPLLFSQALQAAQTHIVFESGLPVGKVSNFQRHYDALDD